MSYDDNEPCEVQAASSNRPTKAMGFGKQTGQSKKVNFKRQYSHIFRKAIPGEVAVCLERALLTLGWEYTEEPIVKKTPFGDHETPFARHNVRINNMEIGIPWGMFEVDGLGNLTPDMNDEAQFILSCALCAGVKVTKWQALIAAVEVELARPEARIFRGNAIKIESPQDTIVPNLLDTSKELPFILNPDVEEQLNTALFLPIERRADLVGRVRLKRGIIMEGMYGVGKSLTAYVAAQKAVKSGWTFLTVRSRLVRRALSLAILLQPCVLFVEDLDEVAHGDRDSLNALLNMLSGIESKAAPEIIFLVSTNFIKRLDPSFLRPERIDAIVTLTPPNADTVGRLITHFAGDLFDNEHIVPFEKLCAYLAGTTPAIISEAVERAKIVAITTDTRITVADLMRHAKSMERQRELATPKFNEPTMPIQLARSLESVVAGDYLS